MWGEAYTFTRYYLEDDSVFSVYINFPDPWPKKRHAKHRLITKEFVLQLHRVLKHEGEVTIVTDDQAYGESICKYMLEDKEIFQSVFPSPYFVTDIEDYGSSYFEKLWKYSPDQIT